MNASRYRVAIGEEYRSIRHQQVRDQGCVRCSASGVDANIAYTVCGGSRAGHVAEIDINTITIMIH
ncbi:MAG: hypothetical protein EP324_08220 [Gammaproteobacteria bacterium]|nr:MAG: hypothetical protein EP324_08220 [Gammaproteobacteria bacterium]